MVFSPDVMATQAKTGITEIIRVTSRRAQRGIFMWTNPSMMTCPVRVPVMVEFCPDASRATANRVERTPDLATAIRTGLDSIEVLFKASYRPKKELSWTAPVLKTATPMINSNELTINASDNWMLESQVVKRTVCRILSRSSWSIFRVCEIAEWR